MPQQVGQGTRPSPAHRGQGTGAASVPPEHREQRSCPLPRQSSQSMMSGPGEARPAYSPFR
jgi:hypothetical protein